MLTPPWVRHPTTRKCPWSSLFRFEAVQPNQRCQAFDRSAGWPPASTSTKAPSHDRCCRPPSTTATPIPTPSWTSSTASTVPTSAQRSAAARQTPVTPPRSTTCRPHDAGRTGGGSRRGPRSPRLDAEPAARYPTTRPSVPHTATRIPRAGRHTHGPLVGPAVRSRTVALDAPCYQSDDATDRVVVVTIKDARSSRAAARNGERPKRRYQATRRCAIASRSEGAVAGCASARRNYLRSARRSTASTSATATSPTRTSSNSHTGNSTRTAPRPSATWTPHPPTPPTGRRCGCPPRWPASAGGSRDRRG